MCVTLNTFSIFYLDDEPDIREIVSTALSLDPAVEVETFATGKGLLACLEAGLPDLLVMDVMMPGNDGPAMLAQLRANPKTATIPVVFVTARAELFAPDEYAELGVIGTLSKPFDPLSFGADLRALWVRSAASSSATTHSAANNLRERFLAEAPLSAGTLRSFNPPLAATDKATAQSLKHLAHRLAGTAGSFGFAEVSAVAARLSELVKDTNLLLADVTRQSAAHAEAEKLAGLLVKLPA